MKFKLKRIVEGIEVEVVFDSLDELGTALTNLREIMQSVRIENAQRRAQLLWNQTDNVRRVTASIEDSGERIALSLLDRWPNPARNIDITADTGLSRAGVYDHLTGRRGDKADWFRTDDELYSLSETGEAEVIKLVTNLANQEE
ncbi:MAG: hypothetical protein ACFFER_17125 [Candidatus Thorarchaeota archaeon]